MMRHINFSIVPLFTIWLLFNLASLKRKFSGKSKRSKRLDGFSSFLFFFLLHFIAAIKIINQYAFSQPATISSFVNYQLRAGTRGNPYNHKLEIVPGNLEVVEEVHFKSRVLNKFEMLSKFAIMNFLHNSDS